MADTTELADEQRRALDRLRSLADDLGLYLAGGTAIALQLHHRVSRDLDLFSREPTFDLEVARSRLIDLADAEVMSITDTALRMRIGNVPIDVVRYPYPLLDATCQGPDQFPLASLRDLATMKLSAVARRGIRRDFWDLHAICQNGRVSLELALDSYVRRYGVRESNLYHVLRALTYFVDAEADPLLPDGLTLEHWAVMKSWFLDRAHQLLRSGIEAD